VAAEGAGALWSGFRVNLVRVLPSCVATFVSYELIAR
jgi:Mitochondrial carrier protein